MKAHRACKTLFRNLSVSGTKYDVTGAVIDYLLSETLQCSQFNACNLAKQRIYIINFE